MPSFFFFFCFVCENWKCWKSGNTFENFLYFHYGLNEIEEKGCKLIVVPIVDVIRVIKDYSQLIFKSSYIGSVAALRALKLTVFDV